MTLMNFSTLTLFGAKEEKNLIHSVNEFCIVLNTTVLYSVA